ncbi:hypothetical protein FB451DRAFT_1497055 [Mycena latifolia]|nr:hypothetical protein FB451DRAFT_1497055 [Mycena latifolia]
MEMPRLSTRPGNKDIRPGVKAGLEKKTRRNADEMAKARADETTANAKAALEQKKKLKKLAELEDKQQRADVAYAKTANHPADRPLTAPTPVISAGTAGGGAGVDPDSGDDSDVFVPGSKESSDEESEDDASEEDEELQKKKKKRVVTSRADIAAARDTEDPSGTPAVVVAQDSKKKRKNKDKEAGKPKKKAKLTGKKSGLDKDKSRGVAAAGGDEDSMVVQGGPALDDDTQEHVERPKTGKKKKGPPAPPPITIQVVARVSRKQQRGGTAKWTLKHLPEDTAAEFTNEVVPLARELAGTVAPWAGLTVKQIQGIVDKVYGPGVHKVTPDGAWAGLIGYRLSDWRSGIGTQATKGIDALVASYEEEMEEEAEVVSDSEAPMPAAVSDDTTSATAADATDTPADAGDVVPAEAAKPLKFAFDTPAGIAAFITWALQSHAESGTMAFHWKTWGNGKDKSGFLQSHLIVYTFAYHMSCLAAVPGGYKRLDAPPIGALLLSVQAVQRALQFWQTGVYVNPQKTANHFSIDNWGDSVITSGQKKDKLVRRATKFMASVQKWDEDRWVELKAAASEWVELPGRKRGGSSRSGSEAEDNAVLEEDDEIIILSD